MRALFFTSIALASLLVVTCQVAAQGGDATAGDANAHRSCAITAPPVPLFRPPLPYPQTLPQDSFWYGSEKLWTNLPADGVWHGLRNEKGYRTKVFWFRRGYDARTEPEPALIVTGHRLDGDTPAFAITEATNAFPTPRAAMLTAFEIPSSGCWQITGEYHGDSLSFIVWVAR